MTPFQMALGHVFKVEGGYVNHPGDKGGPTNYGITLATLCAYRKKVVSAEDVKRLTKAEAAKIYEHFYWNTLGVSAIKSTKLTCILFDQAVNRGVASAAQTLQKVLNQKFNCSLREDGRLGSKTAEAANLQDPWKLAIEYIKAAQEFYVNLVVRNPPQLVFLKGWLNRVNQLWDLLV